MKFIDLQTQYVGIKEKVDARIQAVLDHGQYIMGKEVKEFEALAADYVGVKHAIGCSSGTDALLLALMALDIKPGDEVITTPFSFYATAEVIAFLGAKPVFVDIDEHTYNIDASKVESAITEKTRVVMPVSLYGQCADMGALTAICKKHDLKLIEDGAQSFGATYHGKQSCSFNDIGTTSFFPSKPLGCYGDAGMCFTNDDATAKKLRQLLFHGQSARYMHQYIGMNGRMDTIQAAVLIEKLEIFDKENEARQRIAKRYQSLLEGLVQTPFVSAHNESVFAQYTIEVDNREQVVAKMTEQGVQTAVHYPLSLHQQEALLYLGYKDGDFPVAESKSKRVMSLPMSPYLSEEDQDKVASALKVALG